MESIRSSLNVNHLVQVDTSEDSYYLGTKEQLTYFIDYQHNCEKKLDEKSDPIYKGVTKLFNVLTPWCWISDYNVSLAKYSALDSIFVSSDQMMSSFQLYLKTMRSSASDILHISAVHIIQPTTWMSSTIYDNNDNRDYHFLDFCRSLLIGSAKAVSSAEMFYDCVVNCTNNLKCPNHISPKNCLQLYWEDESHQNIMDNLFFQLEIVYNWITKEQKRVLVYCELGISRSASFVMAYHMFCDYKNRQNNNDNNSVLTVRQALVWLKEKKSTVKPNPSFLKQLRNLETASFFQQWEREEQQQQQRLKEQEQEQEQEQQREQQNNFDKHCIEEKKISERQSAQQSEAQCNNKQKEAPNNVTINTASDDGNVGKEEEIQAELTNVMITEKKTKRKYPRHNLMAAVPQKPFNDDCSFIEGTKK